MCKPSAHTRTAACVHASHCRECAPCAAGTNGASAAEVEDYLTAGLLSYVGNESYMGGDPHVGDGASQLVGAGGADGREGDGSSILVGAGSPRLRAAFNTVVSDPACRAYRDKAIVELEKHELMQVCNRPRPPRQMPRPPTRPFRPSPCHPVRPNLTSPESVTSPCAYAPLQRMEQLATRRAEQTAEAASAARLYTAYREGGEAASADAARVHAAWKATADEQAATADELRRVRGEYDQAKWKGRWAADVRA